MAVLVRLAPLALDAPRAEALVVGVVARKVAVLDQPPAHVAAVEVDGFVLAHCWEGGRGANVVGEREREVEIPCNSAMGVSGVKEWRWVVDCGCVGGRECAMRSALVSNRRTGVSRHSYVHTVVSRMSMNV